MGGKRPWVKQPEEIRLDSDGFDVLIGGEHQFRVNWNSVRGIAAFKRDLFTIDEICLAFRDSDDSEYKIVNESMEHYDELTDEIERRYPEHQPDWWLRCAVPAFATCWTVIWGEAPESAECPHCAADISGSAEGRCPHCDASLATRPCPECRGRGAFREWWWKWAAGAGIVAGAALLAVSTFAPLGHSMERALRGCGAGVLAGAVMCAIFAIRDRSWPCTDCEGTGWWDPRGRAARQIPSVW